MGEVDDGGKRVLGKFGVTRGGEEVGEFVESEENDMERWRRC